MGLVVLRKTSVPIVGHKALNADTADPPSSVLYRDGSGGLDREGGGGAQTPTMSSKYKTGPPFKNNPVSRISILFEGTLPRSSMISSLRGD